MLQPEFLGSDKPPKCTFMQVIKNSESSLTINFDIAYSPNTTAINELVKKVLCKNIHLKIIFLKIELIQNLKAL